MILVRRMTEQDYRAAADNEATCFPAPDRHAAWREETARSMAMYDGQRGIGFVAVEIPERTHVCTVCAPDAPRVIAHATVFFAPDEGQIINVATHPDYRCRGVGHMLMDAIERDARERGFTLLSLEVRVSNAPALALYRAHGFDVAGVRKNFYTAPREDAYVMLKHLD